MKLTTFSLLALTAASSTALAETMPSDLLGTWQTPLAEQQAPDGSQSAYLSQTVVFTDNHETIRAEVFADPDGQMPIFTYASTGPYDVVGKSRVVDNALDIELVNDSSTVTIFMDVPDLMAAVGMGDCDLIIGTAVNVTDCVSGPPFSVTDCIDLDLVAVDQEGQRLRFGADGVNRCVTRPTALSEIAFFKVD